MLNIVVKKGCLFRLFKIRLKTLRMRCNVTNTYILKLKILPTQSSNNAVQNLFGYWERWSWSGCVYLLLILTCIKSVLCSVMLGMYTNKLLANEFSSFLYSFVTTTSVQIVWPIGTLLWKLIHPKNSLHNNIH